MIRYPAFDPPEYIDWKADEEALSEFAGTVARDPERTELIESLNNKQLLGLYEGLLRNRLHDIALKRWVKQGVISKAWLGCGEEATTIGPVHAINRFDGNSQSFDLVAPMIRNAGACHEMGMPLADMFRGYLGTADSPTQGRDLHIGDFNRGVLAPISHVGDIMAVTAGVALAFKLSGEPRIAMTWIGDGSTKSGVFHESMNFAAVQRLPMIVVVQDNKVALGTRLDQHHRGTFLDWPAAYGIEGTAFDGNNVLDAWAATKLAAECCRAGGGPVMLIANTFRMGGHATHDEREARQTFNSALFEYWGKRDPIGLFEAFLAKGSLDLETGTRETPSQSLVDRNLKVLARLETTVIDEIEHAAVEALQSASSNMPRPETAGEGVYAAEDCHRQEAVAS